MIRREIMNPMVMVKQKRVKEKKSLLLHMSLIILMIFSLVLMKTQMHAL